MEEKQQHYQIRMAYQEDWEDSIVLAWKTFLEFEANDYTREGVESFHNFITDQTLKKMFLKGEYQMFVAVKGDQLVGMITLRNHSHVSLLFVDKAYHHQGIGRTLVKQLSDYLLRETEIYRITVNSSPYAIGFYHKLGFQDLGHEMESEGIRYTPMEFIL